MMDLSQPELIGAILKELDRQGVPYVVPEDLNAITKAANEILAQIKATEAKDTP
jgi:hypothetical protein